MGSENDGGGGRPGYNAISTTSQDIKQTNKKMNMKPLFNITTSQNVG